MNDSCPRCLRREVLPIRDMEGYDGNRLANWATRKAYVLRTGARWRIAWLVIQVDALAWITSHQVQARDAWRRRNDPPPPRSPAR